MLNTCVFLKMDSAADVLTSDAKYVTSWQPCNKVGKKSHTETLPQLYFD